MKSNYQPEPLVKITHPEWSKNATIYQINTRQFTQEGTFKAAETHLPRLKDLGVDILWLMPVHEIGKKNRKGTLGSPYSVRDYYSINHEFGTMADFKHFVEAAHKMGMYIIIDWVPNHTAWDNVLTEQHPEWYSRDWKGDFIPTPWEDWDDVIDLDYSIPEVRKYMSAAMKFWVTETGIDGFRCDVAGFVPLDFWNTLRKELDAIKPVFMLAEWETRDLHFESFDMTYGWSWYDTMAAIANGKATVHHLFRYYAWNTKAYPFEIMRMLFVSNHDKNSWEATSHEQFGPALDAVIALSVVSEGMPLLYNGQEAGEETRLPFFEKDPIQWKEHPTSTLYKKLFALKKQNTALWNAQWGARMIRIPNTCTAEIFSFVRQNEKDKVFAVFNFSAENQTVKFSSSLAHGQYMDFTDGKSTLFDENTPLLLKPWEYRIFTK